MSTINHTAVTARMIHQLDEMEAVVHGLKSTETNVIKNDN